MSDLFLFIQRIQCITCVKRYYLKVIWGILVTCSNFNVTSSLYHPTISVGFHKMRWAGVSMSAHALPDAEVCNYDAISQKCLNRPSTDGARPELFKHSLNSSAVCVALHRPFIFFIAIWRHTRQRLLYARLKIWAPVKRNLKIPITNRKFNSR